VLLEFDQSAGGPRRIYARALVDGAIRESAGVHKKA
jgi:hypothetical protein